MMKNASTVCLKCIEITSLKTPSIPSVYTLLKTLDRELEAGNQRTYTSAVCSRSIEITACNTRPICYCVASHWLPCNVTDRSIWGGRGRNKRGRLHVIRCNYRQEQEGNVFRNVCQSLCPGGIVCL